MERMKKHIIRQIERAMFSIKDLSRESLENDYFDLSTWYNKYAEMCRLSIEELSLSYTDKFFPHVDEGYLLKDIRKGILCHEILKINTDKPGKFFQNNPRLEIVALTFWLLGYKKHTIRHFFLSGTNFRQDMVCNPFLTILDFVYQYHNGGFLDIEETVYVAKTLQLKNKQLSEEMFLFYLKTGKLPL